MYCQVVAKRLNSTKSEEGKITSQQTQVLQNYN